MLVGLDQTVQPNILLNHQLSTFNQHSIPSDDVMSDESPSDRKKARLDVEQDREEPLTEVIVPLEQQDDNPNISNKEDEVTGPSDQQALYAARLSRIIDNRPKTLAQPTKTVLAWSSTNLIAIARSKKITLVHVLAPFRVCHLSTRERANKLSFSPNGNALLATFHESASASLWTCSSNVLNDWTLRGEWTQMEGKVLDVKWLSEGRPRMPSNLSKRAARGPQLNLANGRSDIAVILITDIGLVKIIEGNTNSSSELRSYQHKISLSSHHRLQQASIGLVPDESLAILAYTLRYSSKANLPHASGAGDALDMFFDDAEGSDPASSNATPSDGQDKIELTELKIDLHPAEETMALHSRSLPPIFTASFEGTPMPTSKNLNQLAWVHIESTEKDDSAVLQLFGSFFSNCDTILRTWKIRREEISRLSEAFTKLESAKVSHLSSDDEEWTVQDSKDLIVHKEQLSEFTSSAWMENRFVCNSIASPPFNKIEDTPKLELRYKVINTESMTLSSLQGDESLVWKCKDNLCRLAVSPHATMLAGIGRGKIALASVKGLLHESADDVSLYSAAILNGQDFSDLNNARAMPSIDQIAARLKLDRNLSFPHALLLLSLKLKREKDNNSSFHTDRTMLELAAAFRIVASASDAMEESVRLRKVWTMVGQLHWIIKILEMTARQAHLLDVKVKESSPASMMDSEQDVKKDEEQCEYTAKKEPDMLSLLSHTVPRQILVKIIVKSIAFLNWMEGMLEGEKSESKAAFKHLAIQAQRQSQVGSELISSGTVERMTGMLQLSHTKMREMILESGINISEFGRFLQSYLDTVKEENEDGQEKWFLMTSRSIESRKAFARALLSSNSICNMLDLFCPSSDWTIPSLGEESIPFMDLEVDSNNLVFSQSRSMECDILTRMKLSSLSATCKRCLSCQVQTQADVSKGVRCVCGANNWWTSSEI